MRPTVGDVLKPLRIASVSADSMKAWAGFLRDPNPLHLDPAAVQAKGLGDRVINQGPANLGYVITMLQRAYPGADIEFLESRFVDNVFAGDDVEASGRVISVEPQDGDRVRVSCEVWLKADARAEVIAGTAVLQVPVKLAG